jgi:hypothetical protein
MCGYVKVSMDIFWISCLDIFKTYPQFISNLSSDILTYPNISFPIQTYPVISFDILGDMLPDALDTCTYQNSKTVSLYVIVGLIQTGQIRKSASTVTRKPS